MPRVLSDTDVADFRGRLCEAAERLFAEKGLESVTMRQLASELGVSPMTPYRYFKDKDDILAAVRTSGFDRFADALEAARDTTDDARRRGAAVGQAYMNFAFENPHTYRLMFGLGQSDEAAHPDLARATERAHANQSAYVRDLVEAGVLEGDPDKVGQMFWAASHGVIQLWMTGKLKSREQARDLVGAINQAISRGLRPGRS